MRREWRIRVFESSSPSKIRLPKSEGYVQQTGLFKICLIKF